MRLHTFEHEGSEPFPSLVSIDFDKLADITAIHGPYGSGKTTLLDLITAALYLKMPYRSGALYSGFVKPGYVRLGFSHMGHRYLSVLTISPKQRKIEALLYQDDKPAPIAGPSQAEFTSKTEQLFGDLNLFLVTSYAAQYSVTATQRPVTFMGVSRADRRAMMANMLGLYRYESYKQDVDQKIVLFDKEIAAEQVRRSVKAPLAMQVAALEREHQDAVAQVESATQAVAWARSTLDDVQQRLRSQADDMATLAKIDQQLPKEQRAKIDWSIKASTLRQPITIPVVEVDSTDIAAAEEAIQLCDAELAELDAQLDGVREYERQMAKASNRSREITASLREIEILEKVPCKGVGEYAGCPFLVRAADIKQREPTLATERADLAARLDEMRSVMATQPGLMTKKDELRRAREGHNRRIAQARGAALEHDRAILREQARTDSLAQVNRELEACEARVAELEQQRASILATMTLGLQEQAMSAASEVREAETAKNEAIRAASSLETRLHVAREAAAAVKDADVTIAALQEDAAQWAIIAHGVGARGIPALRVDLALPAISEMATTLLRECFGEGRWEVAIVSQKEGTKTVLETLEVVVTRNGKRLDADRLSGGEGVIVNEAVSLALAMYRGTRQRSVWEPGVLMRDETSSSLGKASPAYVELFRNVIAKGGAKQVLIVSHQTDVIERAGSRVLVENGALIVE